MQKDTMTTLLATPILGAFGFFFRWLQLDNSFDDVSGLPIVGSLWHKTMFLMCAAALIFFLARVILLHLRQHPFCRDITYLGKDASLLFYAGALASSLLILVCGLLLFINPYVYPIPGFYRLLGFLVMLSGCCTGALTLTFLFPYKPSGLDLRCVFTMLPVATVAFWLFVLYHENASNPVVWVYSIYVLTICMTLLSLFFLAGYFFETPRPLPLLFTAAMAGFFSITSIADAHPLIIKLMMLGFASFLLVYTGKILPSRTKKH